ncbi:MAG TPA: glycoside hydrolase family 3 N-terminal domain-containing protein [Polyangiaceae bacterium]|nr:glycoside hydrolase family 3 N-terminal domain-containing protein [Polyangiaceae bacterium]
MQRAVWVVLGALVSLGCDPPPSEPTAASAAPPRQRAPKLTKHEFPFRDPRLSADARAADIVRRLTLAEKIAQLSHAAPAIERLGIPEYNWWNEALHGVARNGRATVFPQAIGMAATFDPGLIKQVASAIADEARAKFNSARELGNHGAYAGLTFWSPNINIFRDPRWGRGQETYGEDPFLTSRLGVAFIQGLQGDHPKVLKTAACAKHFAVHSGPEALRHEFDVAPSKKDLFETYLPAFEAAVREGKVEAVMSAYNRLYGEPCSGSKFLLDDLLRQRWQFAGHVVSDCWALVDFHTQHGVTENATASAAKALLAGVDLDCGSTYPELKTAAASSLVDQAAIDRAATRLMRTRVKLGLFDPPGSVGFDNLPPDIVSSSKHNKLARLVATKSLVLLKNSNRTLPLSPKIKGLMLLGPYVTDGDVLLGNYFGGAARLTTLFEGVMAAVDAGSSVEYKGAFLAARPNENPIDWATGAAHERDAIIITLGLSGRLEGEEGAANESQFKGDRQDIGLPPHQLEYLKKLRRAGNTKIIAVLFGGSALAIPEVHELCDAVLLAWYPGQEGGHAIADVVFGHEAPSGKLPITFPMSTKDLPPFHDYAMAGRTYRYATKAPLYPFGFGLSYGQLVYEALQLSQTKVQAGETLEAVVRLKNASDRDIEEVVQLYLTDVEASVPVPTASLVAFQRVRLGAGRTRSVELTIPAHALQVVTATGERRFEPGAFVVHAGGAAPVPRAVELGAPEPLKQSFELTAE